MNHRVVLFATFLYVKYHSAVCVYYVLVAIGRCLGQSELLSRFSIERSIYETNPFFFDLLF